MEGKINAEGVLEIKRGRKFKQMECRQLGEAVMDSQDNLINVLCGDDCSKFGEPESHAEDNTLICLCDKDTWLFDEFTDERL